jgi:glycosyltransferase involved in cell wall biosynthesis
VDFVGTIPKQAVAQWLHSLDLLVCADKTDRHGEVDGIPVNLTAAMSLGVTVVSTRVSGVPELVVDGQTGYLAEPGDPQSLAARIDRAMAEPERARALGRAARAHVRWEFGRELNLRRLLRHFGGSPRAQTQPAELQRVA